jgi:hypothetical protein
MVRIIFLSGFLLAGVLSFGHTKSDSPHPLYQSVDQASGGPFLSFLHADSGITTSADGMKAALSVPVKWEVPVRSNTVIRAPFADYEEDSLAGPMVKNCVVKITAGNVTLTITSTNCEFLIKSISRIDQTPLTQADPDPVFRIDRPVL